LDYSICWKMRKGGMSWERIERQHTTHESNKKVAKFRENTLCVVLVGEGQKILDQKKIHV
jgi:hypothetical protein